MNWLNRPKPRPVVPAKDTESEALRRMEDHIDDVRQRVARIETRLMSLADQLHIDVRKKS